MSDSLDMSDTDPHRSRRHPTAVRRRSPPGGSRRPRPTSSPGPSTPARAPSTTPASSTSCAATTGTPRPRTSLGRDPVDVLGAVRQPPPRRAEPPAGHRRRPRLHPDGRGPRLVGRRTPSSRSSPTTCRSSSTRSRRRSACRAATIHLVVHPQFVVAATSPARCSEVARRRRRGASRARGRDRRVVDARRDRPRDRRRRRCAASRSQSAAGAARRPRGGRGLAADARAGADASPTSSRPHPPATRRRRRGRRVGRPAALAGRRPLHLPRLPRVRARASDGDAALDARARHRPRHPALATGPASVARHDAARREVRARAREPHVLVLTKANSRSTVHRPAYLDYVGVKTFDADGNVVGERRFLGLFTSTRLHRSRCMHDPGAARARSTQVLDAVGLPRRQPLRQGPAADPRDLPARRAVPDRPSTSCTEIALAVLHMQERRQMRLFMRRDRYGRFVSVPGLPAARPLHHHRPPAHRPTSSRGVRRRPRRLHRPRHRVDARPPALRRAPPARRSRCPSVDTTRSSARLAEATRSWDDDFADALRRPVRRGAGRAPAARRYADAFPEAYKEDFPARTGVVRPRASSRRSPADGGVALTLYEPLRRRRAASAASRSTAAAAPISLSDVLPVLQQHGRRGRRRAALRASRPLGRPIVDLRLRPAPRRRPRLRARQPQGAVPGRVPRRVERAAPRSTASTRSSSPPA